MDSMETVHSYVVISDDPQQQYQQLQQQYLQLQQQNQQLQQQLQQLQQYNEHDLGSSTQRPQQNYKQQQPQLYPGHQQQSSDPHASQPQLEICLSDEKQLNVPPEQMISALYRAKSNPLPTHSVIAQGSYSEAIYDARNQAHITSYHNQHIPPHPLYGQHRDQDGSNSYRNKSCIGRFRYQLGEKIESKAAHLTILFLTIVDIILVMLQIFASLLHPHMSEKEVWYMELFSHLSLAIVSLFLLEILLKLFAFGPRYFWRGTPHWALHLVDAVIILTTFFLELLLHGVSQEIGSLLIVFRLWRVVKLMSTIAIGVSNHEQENAALLEARIQKLEKELAESTLKCQRLEGFNGQPRSEN